MMKYKANFLPCTRHRIEVLYKELLLLTPFLKDIQEHQKEYEELKDLWMRIIGVAYRAEHVIDSCQILDVPICYNTICLSIVTEEIKFIKTEIQNREKHFYNIEAINAQRDSSSSRLAQADTSRLYEVVVGFEDEAEKVIDRLIGGSSKLDIVSIVGMPGQGKTTLAKKVYNNPLVRNYFNKCAWCIVTQVYSVKQLLDILRDVAVLGDEMQNMSQEDLALKLCQSLRGGRYLIVMDDIWDIKAWNELKLSFPNEETGSRILFTSRNNIVGLQKEFDSHPHWLRSLSEDESMELLTQKLFPKDGCPSKFLNDVEQILKMCNGLPLAVVVVAGLLKRASNDLDQWRKFVRNIDLRLASEECMDILELSYNNLPDFLKSCFLYLAAVAEAKVFKVQKLIELWIAEGFIQGTKVERLNDVAMEYLVDLVSRSLVIVTKRSSTGEIKECRIHDLVRELCLTKAKEERFIYFPDTYSSNPIVYEPYRICITQSFPTCIKSKLAARSVRSLLTSSRQFFYYYYYTNLKFLRVLNLETEELGWFSLHEIASLICLRYLAAKSDVEELPPSIGSLRSLETFRLVRSRAKDTLRFPQTFWRMKSLRNVDIPGGVIISLNDYEIEDSSQLRNLDRFSSLYLCHVDSAEKVLRRLPSVRKLRLEFSRFWVWSWNINLFDVLNSLSMLESVSMYYDSTGVVRGLGLFNFPSTLKKLTLSGSGLPWSATSAIAKLPNLEVLKLLTNSFSGLQWEVEDEFLNLKFLKLYGLDFKKWNASIDSFPCLEQLLVEKCRFLEDIPSSFGEISTWKKIDIRCCTRKVTASAWRILRQQRELGNEDLEVLVSGEDSPRWTPWHLDDNWDWTMPIPAYPRIWFDERIKRIAICKPILWIRKTQDEHARRVNNVYKYNCQSRQAILNRHFRDMLKRDG